MNDWGRAWGIWYHSAKRCQNFWVPYPDGRIWCNKHERWIAQRFRK